MHAFRVAINLKLKILHFDQGTCAYEILQVWHDYLKVIRDWKIGQTRLRANSYSLYTRYVSMSALY